MSETSLRKDAFKALIMQRLRSADGPVPLSDLEAFIQSERPELCSDEEECGPACKGKHPRWRHVVSRSLQDLKQAIPGSSDLRVG